MIYHSVKIDVDIKSSLSSLTNHVHLDLSASLQIDSKVGTVSYRFLVCGCISRHHHPIFIPRNCLVQAFLLITSLIGRYNQRP